MKTKLLILTFLQFATLAFGQWSVAPTTPLNEEERQLLDAFRANPSPFRALLAGGGRVLPRVAAVAGPRDEIDVTISGGKIAFYGKRNVYLPASLRLARGEVGNLIVGRENSGFETIIRVAFLGDGLHFDVPEPYGRAATLHGFIVIPESREWRDGTPIRWSGHLDDPSSRSKAENIEFRVRYVAR